MKKIKRRREISRSKDSRRELIHLEKSTVEAINNQRGEISSRGRWRGAPKPMYDKSRFKCYNCVKFGHYVSECIAHINRRVKESANYVEEIN